MIHSKNLLRFFLVPMLVILPVASFADHYVHGYTRKNGTYVAPHYSKDAHSHIAVPTVPRESNGRIKRSSSEKHAFEKEHPCPATNKTSGPCPGYVVDHIIPLKRGGADDPSNMQWQTTEAAKQKDKVE